MPSLEDVLMAALEATLEAEVPPQAPSIADLVNVLGGPRRGGGTTRLAGMLDVEPRTVQRWLKTERGEAGETRAAPTARVRGLTAAHRATLDQIRGLWTDRDRRVDVLERKLRGRKLVVAWDITWEPYPEVKPGGVRREPAPPWRDEGRFGPVTIPEYRAAPIIRDGIEVLRTGDVEVLQHAAGLLAGELAGWCGLPGEAEADEVHSLTISFE
jgi:hypothetical protein